MLCVIPSVAVVIYGILLIVSSETLIQNVMSQRVVLPPQQQGLNAALPQQSSRGRVVLPPQGQQLLPQPQQPQAQQPRQFLPQPQAQQPRQFLPQPQAQQPRQFLPKPQAQQPRQFLPQPQRPQTQPQRQSQQLKEPDCGYFRIDTTCVDKCKMKSDFNRGYLDMNNYCRCYNAKNSYYYVDFMGVNDFPHPTEPFCENDYVNQRCDNNCKYREKWQRGYCSQKDVCQCRNISKENRNFFKDICYE